MSPYPGLPRKPLALERALICFARHFPLARGKLRVVDAVWPLVAGGDPMRTAELIYGAEGRGYQMPCDLRETLQRQYYFFGTYYLERGLLACWMRLSDSARVVFDVGANAGIYSLATLAANPHAEVHAFEPTPEIAERLRHTKTMNALRTLHVQEMAVAEQAGEATLVRCRGALGSNEGMNYISADRNAGSEQVAAISLDAFCKANAIEHIDLLKLDIQGGESAALRGAAGLLSERRIGMIFMELEWGAAGTNCQASQSVALLEAHGYRFAEPAARPAWRAPGDWMRSLHDIIAARSPELAASGAGSVA